jgi:hypothetical protein
MRVAPPTVKLLWIIYLQPRHCQAFAAGAKKKSSNKYRLHPLYIDGINSLETDAMSIGWGGRHSGSECLCLFFMRNPVEGERNSGMIPNGIPG